MVLQIEREYYMCLYNLGLHHHQGNCGMHPFPVCAWWHSPRYAHISHPPRMTLALSLDIPLNKTWTTQGLHIAKLHMAISVPFFAYIPARKQRNKSARGVSLQNDKDSVIFFIFRVLGISTTPNTFTMAVTPTTINSLQYQFSRVFHSSLSQEAGKGSIRDLGDTADWMSVHPTCSVTSVVPDSVSLWAAARQVSLSTGFSDKNPRVDCHALLHWMFVSPQNSYVEILSSRAMVFGSGAFGRWLGHKSGALMNGTRALIEDTTESFLTPFATWSLRRRHLSVNQEAGPPQTLCMTAPWWWTS